MAAGLKRYFTGAPCPKGHVAERRAHNGECIECSLVSNRKRKAEWRAENPDEDRARSAAWRAANPEKKKACEEAWRAANNDKVNANKAKWREKNREKIRADSVERYAANVEKERARSASFRAENPEKRREITAAYRAANPDANRIASNVRRARKREAGGHHTAEDIRRIHDAQKGRCACCRVKVGKSYHIDHIQPLALGGNNWPANLQLLCATCNLKKGARDPLDFSREQGLLL
jgi:5-methylcytosine-specific restriction endonuclease McrA